MQLSLIFPKDPLYTFKSEMIQNKTDDTNEARGRLETKVKPPSPSAARGSRGYIGECPYLPQS